MELIIRSADPGGLRGGTRSLLDRGDAGMILVKDSLLPVICRSGAVDKPPSEDEESNCFRLKSCFKQSRAISYYYNRSIVSPYQFIFPIYFYYSIEINLIDSKNKIFHPRVKNSFFTKICINLNIVL